MDALAVTSGDRSEHAPDIAATARPSGRTADRHAPAGELCQGQHAGRPSHLYGISGTAYPVEIENGQRVAWTSLDDAYAAISSPLNLAFFELNADLRRTLGGVKPPHHHGIRLSDMLQAVEDLRPVNFNNKGGVTTRQSLAMLRRAR